MVDAKFVVSNYSAPYFMVVTIFFRSQETK
jgi:hypothetical protein